MWFSWDVVIFRHRGILGNNLNFLVMEGSGLAHWQWIDYRQADPSDQAWMGSSILKPAKKECRSQSPFFKGCHPFLHRWPCCLRLNPPSKKLLCTDPSKIQQLHSNFLVGGLEHLDYFSHDIGNIIIPTDFHSIIFQRGWLKPPTSNSMSFTRVLFASDLSHMLHVWYIYLQNRVIFRANVGIHIPAPWSIWSIFLEAILLRMHWPRPQLFRLSQRSHLAWTDAAWKSWLCLWKRWRRWRPGDGSAMGHPPAGSSYFHPK